MSFAFTNRLALRGRVMTTWSPGSLRSCLSAGTAVRRALRSMMMASIMMLSSVILSACASPQGGAAERPTAATGEEAGAAIPDRAAPSTPSSTGSRTALIWVNGMACPLCSNNVDQQLKRLPGVESVRINLGTGLVSVGLDPANQPTEVALARAVNNSGFTLVRIQMPEASPRTGGGT